MVELREIATHVRFVYPHYTCEMQEYYQKEVKIIKQISKEQIEKLLKMGVIRKSRKGYVASNGEHIGYYRTSGVAKKRYIEDYYADMFEK